jgi:hypothetical protein
MLYCSQHWLDRRCREAGKQTGECDGCIVERGDTLAVDENHADFPRPKPEGGPRLLAKAVNFATSAARHAAAGAPRCTQEQIDARFAICKTCEHFDGTACKKCGCPIKREQAFVSKLAWANESCPVGKWGPVDNSHKGPARE